MESARCNMCREQYSFSEILQVQVVYLFILAGMSLSITFSIIYYYLEMYATMLSLIVSLFSGLVCLWWLKNKRRSEIPAHIALFFFLFIIIIANIEYGGFDNRNDAWFMVVVLISGLLLTKHYVWFYAFVALSVSITFYLLKMNGIEFPQNLSAEKVDLLNLTNRLGSILTTVFLIILFRYERSQREQDVIENEEKLFQLANFDTLTSLSNRGFFAQNFDDRINDDDTEQQALLFIDLDSFKLINDSFGHNVGDELLKVVAARFKTQLTSQDVICRHGGDEFLIMPKSNYSKSDIENICINLISVLKQPFTINDDQLHIGCSIGVAHYPDHGQNYNELLRAADIAMYRSKSQGKEQFQVYNQGLAQEIQNKNQLAIDLRRAIDTDELFLVYQPKVCLSHKTIVGYEALVRWTNSKGQSIEPSVIIAIAEEFSLVHKFGEWLFISIAKQIAEWKRKELLIKPIAINISAHQLLRADFVTELVRITNYYNISPDLIELELTESVFIESASATLNKLNRLSDLGFSLVIDDYGTGYASLGYLKRFPVTGMKIDKSFIDDILDSEQDQKIVGSTIALAHKLGLEIIAEGVENDEQLQLLRKLGCDVIQGYYFSKPLLASEVFTSTLGRN